MSFILKILMLACLLISAWTMRAFAADAPAKKAEAAKPAAAPAKTAAPAAAPAKPAATAAPGAAPAKPADSEGAAEPRKSATGSATVGKDQTSVDFEETLLEGKMKAPAGTFLQGRKDQFKNQLVQLRTNFRRELKRSKGGVRALTD